MNRTPTLLDLKILLESDIQNLHLDLLAGKHNIRSPVMKIRMKNSDIFLQGNTQYNDIILKNLSFKGSLQEREVTDLEKSNIVFFPETLKMTVPLRQDFLLQKIGEHIELESDLDGEVDIELHNKSMVSVNEQKVEIRADFEKAAFDIFDLHKKSGEDAYITANLTHKIHSSSNKIENSRISIPNFKAAGDVIIDNGILKKIDLNIREWDKNIFKVKYHNALQLKKIVHQYDIEGKIIDISPFIKLSQKLQKSRKTTSKSTSDKKEQRIVKISLENLKFENKAVLDDLKLHPGY